MYLKAIEILICRREISRVCFLRLCTKYDTRFSKYLNELIVALSSTNATKIREKTRLFQRRDMVGWLVVLSLTPL